MTIPLAHVRKCLDYDPTTGVLIWRFRRDVPKRWNTRYAGKPAGTINAKGYLQICLTFEGREHLLKAHRVALALANGAWPERDLDHRNRTKNDNRQRNLREATRAQNEYNKGLQANNISGVKGVSWDKHAGKWRAVIVIDKHQRYLGRFDSFEDAVSARLAAEAEIQ